jgi:hypothetical protein
MSSSLVDQQFEQVMELRRQGYSLADIDQFMAENFGADEWAYDYTGDTETSFPGPYSPASARRKREATHLRYEQAVARPRGVER